MNPDPASTPPAGLALPAATPAATIDRENPWPGLGTYDESMHAWFFGRDNEIEELLRLVRRDPVALFYGQSGLGKSSLLQAGLFPRLRALDLLPVHLRLRYGADYPHPTEQILRETVAAARAADGEAPPVPPGISLFEYFYDDTHEIWSSRNRVLTPVLVFDQFEEVFTLGAREPAAQQRRDELLAQLADLAARRPPAGLVRRFEDDPGLAARYGAERTRCRLLFSLREDFLPELGALRAHLPTLASGGLRLQRLRGDQALAVLERAGGHLLEAGAAVRIVRFVAAEKPGSVSQELAELEVEPALLNVVARELNNRRRRRNLELISGDLVQGAREEILTDFYERAFRGLETRVREFVEDQLLTTTGFRDSVAVEDAEASFNIPRSVLAVLVDRRLLRIDERFEMQRVELTHDLLAGVARSSRDRRRERENAAAAQRQAEAEKRLAQEAVAAAQARLRRTRIRVAVIGSLTLLGLGLGVLLPLYARSLTATREAMAQGARAEEAFSVARRSLTEARKAMARFLLVQANAHLSTAASDEARLLLTLADSEQLLPPADVRLIAAATDQSPVLALRATLNLGRRLRQVEFAPDGRLLALDEAGAITIAAPGAARPGADGILAPEAAPGALGRVTDATSLDVFWGQAPAVAVGTRNGEVRVFHPGDGSQIALLRLSEEEEETPGAENAGGAAIAATGPFPLLVRFSTDGTRLAALASDGAVAVWTRASEGSWSSGAGRLLTRAARLRLGPAEMPAATLHWVNDGSLLVGDAEHPVWLTVPRPAWFDEKPVERLNVLEMRATVVPAADMRDSDWFFANRRDNRLHWMRLPADAAAGSDASRYLGAEGTADTVHALLAPPGSDVLFVALRNGSLATYRINSQKTTLRVVQTVAAPKAGRVGLRLRPDGRWLAAVADDGRVSLYAVQLPPPATERQVHALVPANGDTWWQITADRGIIAPGAGEPSERLEVPGASASWVFFPKGERSAAVAFAVLPPGEGAEAAGPRAGLWSFAGSRWLWQRALAEFRTPSQDAEDHPAPPERASLSADGATLAFSAAAPRVWLVSAATGDTVGAPLPVNARPQGLAWSGDSHRLAVATTDQEITVYEPASAHAIVARTHARSYELNALALDHAGHALVYVTPDARLVLELFAQNDEQPPLVIPLPAVGNAVAFTRDNDGLALVIGGSLQVLSPHMPARADLEWLSQSRLEGYRLASQQTHTTELARLDLEAWSDTRDAALAGAAQAGWWRWCQDALDLLRSQAGAASRNPAAVQEHLARGRALHASLKEPAQRLAGVRALADHLGRVAESPLALARYLGPSLPAELRWMLAAEHFASLPAGESIPAAAAAELFPAMVATLEASGPVSDRDRALMRSITLLLAHDSGRNVPVWDRRAALLEHLLSQEEWDEMVFTSPDNWLLEKEAAHRHTSGEYDAALRFYTELARRDPTRMRYRLQRGQELRFLERYEDALVVYREVEETTRAAGDRDAQAEALISVAWCLEGLKRGPEAAPLVIEAVKLAPSDPWTLRQAATYLLNHGPTGPAGEWTARLCLLDPKPEHRLLHARFLLDDRRAAEARPLLEELTATAGGDLELRLDIAERLQASPRRGDKLRAAEWMLEVYERTSDEALEKRALRRFAFASRELGRSAQAAEAFTLLRERLAENDKAWASAFIGEAMLLARDFEAARRTIDESLEAAPTDAWTWIQSGHEHEWHGRIEEALVAFRRGAELEPGEATVALVEALARAGRAEEARAAADAALAARPADEALRLAWAQARLASEAAGARAELVALSEGTAAPIARRARALLGEARAAAEAHAAKLEDPLAGEWVAQAGYRALAWRQTADPAERRRALAALAEAVQAEHRGVLPLRFEFGLGGLAGDPVFRLAEDATTAAPDTPGARLAHLRLEAALAAEFAAAEDAPAQALHLGRARALLEEGLKRGWLQRELVLADPQLAPLLPPPG